MKNGFLVYWVNCKTGVQKFRAIRTFEKADKLRNNLKNQSKFLMVFLTEFKDI